MAKKGGSAPKAPDYTKLAEVQGQQSMQLAQYLTNANRLNQTSPFGSVTYTHDTSVDPQIAALRQQLQGAYDAQNVNRPGYTQAAATAGYNQAQQLEQQIKQLEDQKIQQVTLSPELQAMFGQNMAAQQQALGAITDQGFQFNPSNLPQTIGGVNLGGLPGLQSSLNLGGLPGLTSNINLAGLPQGVGNVGTTLDQLGLLQTPTMDQFKQQGVDAANDLYKSLTFYNNEQNQIQNRQLENKLAGMGLQLGSSAYNQATKQLSDSQNQAYQQAALQAASYAPQVQTQLFNAYTNAAQGNQASNINLLQGRFGQGLTNAQLANALHAQLAGEQFQNAQLGNAARGQAFGEQLSGAQLANAARQQAFGEQYNNAQLANSLQQQLYNQQYQQFLTPYQALSALNGNQVQMPQFPAYNQATPYQPADLLGAAQAQYNAKLGQYNAKQDKLGGLLGTGAQLGGQYMGLKALAAL